MDMLSVNKNGVDRDVFKAFNTYFCHCVNNNDNQYVTIFFPVSVSKQAGL